EVGCTELDKQPLETCVMAVRCLRPRKVLQKWHRKINLIMKCYAMVSILVVSMVPVLVMARGHQLESIPELSLVLSDGVESVEKTSTTIKVLEKVGAIADVNRVKRSHTIRVAKDTVIYCDGKNVVDDIWNVLDKINEFFERV
ncbi:hypothetical protein KI387_042747, partial [Taxus chinensis]